MKISVVKFTEKGQAKVSDQMSLKETGVFLQKLLNVGELHDLIIFNSKGNPLNTIIEQKTRDCIVARIENHSIILTGAL